jgi:hypothetical protein
MTHISWVRQCRSRYDVDGNCHLLLSSMLVDQVSSCRGLASSSSSIAGGVDGVVVLCGVKAVNGWCLLALCCPPSCSSSAKKISAHNNKNKIK